MTKFSLMSIRGSDVCRFQVILIKTLGHSSPFSFSLSGNDKGWIISDTNFEDNAPARLVESLVAYGLIACLLYLSCYMRGKSIYILSETLESVNVGYSALWFCTN